MLLRKVGQEGYCHIEAQRKWVKLQVFNHVHNDSQINPFLSIVDTSGDKYFDILPTDLMDDSMKLVDAKGKEIACFRKERFGAGKRAHITVKNNGE